MRIPRDCHGDVLAAALRRALGYEVVRQSGSHIVLTSQRSGEHHVTVPAHRPIKVGTLHAILKDIANHHQITVDALVQQLKI